MRGLSDVKLRISIKMRDKSIWHGASLSLLSAGERRERLGRADGADKERGGAQTALTCSGRSCSD